MKDAQWLDLYEAAIIEANPTELWAKIKLAEAAIRERRIELAHSHDTSSIEEKRAIGNALQSLNMLERLELGTGLGFGKDTNQTIQQGEAV